MNLTQETIKRIKKDADEFAFNLPYNYPKAGAYYGYEKGATGNQFNNTNQTKT